ncbi:hypothetical protein BDV96DRAFT_604272 [Lophiotrema nucula]|uniref:Uncharacterized protein n=1 Tax=Lophiotrema nucula TaxID=690887 RepID=A0A6A5YVQ3_9PLEO|nr:hypothetical protein BDV96DRAFT_604272 [Lophiotrema nucula]
MRDVRDIQPLGSIWVGWAYLANGSIVVQPANGLDHAAMESYLRLIERCVWARTFDNKPLWRLQIIPRLSKNLSMMLIYARPGQDVRFKTYLCQLDESGSYLSCRPVKDQKDTLIDTRLTKGLAAFRGTLIDGTLQWNVQLGNGLSPAEIEKENPPGTLGGIEAQHSAEPLQEDASAKRGDEPRTISGHGRKTDLSQGTNKSTDQTPFESSPRN